MTYQHYSGLDVHKQFVLATKLDSAGKVVKQWRFATTPKALKSFAASLTKGDAVCRESTTNAMAIYRLIRRQAHRSGHHRHPADAPAADYPRLQPAGGCRSAGGYR